MTEPIEFNPPPMPGSSQAPALPQNQSPGHSSFWPLLIILLTLISTTVRDGIALQKRINQIRIDNARPLMMLQSSDKQAAFVTAVKEDLKAVADFDPKAAQILADYFPNPPAATAPSPPSNKAAPAKSPTK